MSPERLAGSASLFLLALLSLYLSFTLLRQARYSPSSGWWGSGMFAAFISLLEEGLIYSGMENEVLLQSYLFLSALLVALLSIGSVVLARSSWIRGAWLAYMTIGSIALAFFSFTQYVPQSIVMGGAVTGEPPLLIVIFSSIITVPGAIAIVWLALLSAMRERKGAPLLVAAGAIVISAAGALFVFRQLPVTLYYSEFAGLLLIFFGVRYGRHHDID